MSLTIEDFQGKYEANTISDLENALGKSYGSSVNAFWLSHSQEKYPAMSLLVKGHLSTLLYLPFDGHPGFAPVCKEAALDIAEFTTFSADAVEQELEVSNDQVIDISKGLAAARDFFTSTELPRSIEWQEL